MIRWRSVWLTLRSTSTRREEDGRTALCTSLPLARVLCLCFLFSTSFTRSVSSEPEPPSYTVVHSGPKAFSPHLLTHFSSPAACGRSGSYHRPEAASHCAIASLLSTTQSVSECVIKEQETSAGQLSCITFRHLGSTLSLGASPLHFSALRPLSCALVNDTESVA